MLTITRNITLDISKPGKQAVMYARRGDTRIYCYLIRLVNNSTSVQVSPESTIVFVCTKPDNTIVTLPGLSDYGKAKVYVSAEAFTEKGIVSAQLLISDEDGSALYSPSFDIVVEDGVLPEDAMASSSDFAALQTILQQVKGLVERVAVSIVGLPYDTVEALHENVPNPYPWSMYAVGMSAPFDIYRHTGDDTVGYHGWVNHGTLQGPNGAVYVPVISNTGEMSWSNNGGLANPTTVNIADLIAFTGKFMLFSAQTLTTEQKAQARANIEALTYVAATLTDVQKLQALSNISGLAYIEQTLSDTQKLQALSNISGLAYIAQTLTTAQKAQARANMEALTYVAATLTDVQKSQARSNIGALSSNDVYNALDGTDTTKALAAPQGKALGDLIALKIGKLAFRAGTVSISTAPGTNASQAVTFTPAFASAPLVFTTPQTSNPRLLKASATNITETGFTAYAGNDGTSTVTITILWFAFLPE